RRPRRPPRGRPRLPRPRRRTRRDQVPRSLPRHDQRLRSRHRNPGPPGRHQGRAAPRRRLTPENGARPSEPRAGANGAPQEPSSQFWKRKVAVPPQVSVTDIPLGNVMLIPLVFRRLWQVMFPKMAPAATCCIPAGTLSYARVQPVSVKAPHWLFTKLATTVPPFVESTWPVMMSSSLAPL